MALIDDIRGLPTELLTEQDTAKIAAALPPRVRVERREIGKGAVLTTLGIQSGNALLDAIDADPAFRHVKQLVANGCLDIGDPLTRDTLDNLVPQVITKAEADALKALAEIAEPVEEMDVRKACWSDDGEWLP